MKNPTLGLRLLAIFGLLLLFVFVIVSVFLNRNMRQDSVRAAEEQARHGLDALQWIIGNHHAAGPRDFQRWITGIGRGFDFRITYIHEGQVIADSEVPFENLPNLDDHSTRPEVVQAREEGRGASVRYSSTLGRELIYAAVPMAATASAPEGILRVAIPVSDVEKRYQAVLQRMFWFMLLLFAAAAGVALLLLRRVSASLTGFAQTVRRIGEGDYAQRIDSVPGREFAPLVQAVNVMSGKIQAHVASLKDAKGELEALFDGMASGVMILDQKGRIESWNPALAAMFPDMGQARGQTVLEATMQPGLQKLATSLLESPQGTQRMSSRLQTRERRELQAVLVPYRTPGGVRKIVIVFHDITEVRRLERVRQDFMVNITHEIRTPVSSIQGYAETLLDQPDMEAGTRQGFLEVIHKNARHMGHMVEKLLSLARLDAEGEVELEPVDLRETLVTATRTLAQKTQARGVTIRDALPESLPTVMATPPGLLEVLLNLLENAIVYGPEHAEVTVSAEPAGQDCVVSVIDQGQGVPERFRERVFERFFRVDGARNVKEGRYGLGLAICRQLVESFGGRIWLESLLDAGQGAGTALRFSLSLSPEQEQGEGPGAGAAAENV